MPRASYPDVLEVWGITWTKRGGVWEGPLVSDPTPALATSLELGRIEIRGDRYVMVDPGITFDRFGWEDGDLTLTQAAEEEDEAC
jgi:hypothetical protein